MTRWDDLIGLCGAFGVVGGAATVVFLLVLTGPAKRPVFGTRGVKRAQALSESMPFALVEPVLRLVAVPLARVPGRALRVRFAKLLARSGDHLGLTEDELLAGCSLGAFAAGASATLVSIQFGLSPLWAVGSAVVGSLAPAAAISAVSRNRVRRITNNLPGVIELIAMCMSAGLDLPASLARVADSAANEREPIVEELRRMLTALDLGNTRRSVILDFASRVPSPEARELVNSIVQSEEKGSPLAHTLQVQAKTLRVRRSAAAEQAASHAALMLVGPTSLIFICVLVLLLGPVIVRFIVGGGMPA